MSRQISTIATNILLLSGLALCQASCAQSTTVEVTDGRPVGKAAQMLEAIYGLPITYDDPISVHESQLQDVTEQVQRTPDPSHRVIVQKDVTLSFTYRLPTSGLDIANKTDQAQSETEVAVADALKSALDGYANAGGIVTFSVTQEDGVFHVAPTNFLNKDGKLQQMVPILDTKITILPKQRTAAELLNDICQSLSKATGIQVGEGTIPINQLLRSTTSISGSDVTARSILSRLLNESASPISRDVVVDAPDGQRITRNMVVRNGVPLSWRLLYGPGFGYALNIHQVPPVGK